MFVKENPNRKKDTQEKEREKFLERPWEVSPLKFLRRILARINEDADQNKWIGVALNER